MLDTSTSFGPASALTARRCARRSRRCHRHGFRTRRCAIRRAPGCRRLHRVTNCHGAADRSLRAVEHREKAVTRRAHLAAPKPSKLRPHDGVVGIEQRVPVTVTDLRGATRRIHDVGEQHGGENPVIGHVSLLAGEELGDLLERIAPRLHEVVIVAPRQLDVLRTRYVISDVLAPLGRENRSSACWRTSVGTRMVGRTARTSNSAKRGIMRAKVPGLAASRSCRANAARISSFHGMSGLRMLQLSRAPHGDLRR